VLNVQPDSTGHAAGILAGDVVQVYNGVKINSVNELTTVVANWAQKDGNGNFGNPDTKIQVWRDGQSHELMTRRGRLGIALSAAPAKAAWQEWRRSNELLFLSHRDEQLPALVGSRLESVAISKLFGKARFPETRWLGPEATESKIDAWRREGRLARVRYLHLASHALIDPTIAMDSCLIISPQSTRDAPTATDVLANDGRITAAQILRDWQLNSELVVLSACQTAVGQPLAGEGLLGFSQAFLRAGTHSLIVSLWRVEDQASALLMYRFYQNLLASRPGLTAPLSKIAALTEAKHWLRNLSADEADRALRNMASEAELPQFEPQLPPGDRPFEHPSFWAAFVLIGEPN
jgi:CHAT domain-containing protein